jgi:prepilin-type N-terminal cleavage/methylation domain-containing protein
MRSTTAADRSPSAARAGFTLIEVMIATAVSLLLMATVTSFFAFVSQSITESRAGVETSDRLRAVKHRLQADLMGVTVNMLPPRRPEQNEGYLEYIEGPIGPYYLPSQVNGNDDAIDDCDDVLMFTSKSLDEPFLGRCCPPPTTGMAQGATTLQVATVARSQVAEIAWFMRGATLYRRVLLVLPGLTSTNFTNIDTGGASISTNNVFTRRRFYFDFDISMHQEGGNLSRRTPSGSEKNMPRIFSNSLGDLTKRENRYAHQPLVWPYDARFWGRVSGVTAGANPVPNGTLVAVPGLGLPTLAECSTINWPFPFYGYQGYIPWNIQPTYFRPQTTNDPFQCYIAPATGTSAPGPVMSVLCGLPLTSSGTFDPMGGTYATKTTGVPATIVDVKPWPVAQTTALNATYTANQEPGLLASYSTSQGGTLFSNVSSDSGNGPNRVFEDVILTNVLSFDVKVWDPGAPIFSATPSVASVGVNSTPVPIIPGDRGYCNTYYGNSCAVQRFINGPTNGTALLVGFGAYVDLNYMVATGIDPYDLAAEKVNIVSFNPPAPFPFYTNIPNLGNYSKGYEAALRSWEANHGIPATTPMANRMPRPKFSDSGDARSGLQGIPHAYAVAKNPGPPQSHASVYDTWSFHYEEDGIDQDGDGYVDNLTDGIDNPGSLPGIDDPSETEAPPPYPWPLRGMQIKIRAFEPASRQIREVTLVHEFLQE